MGRLKTLDDWLDWQQNLHNKSIDLGLGRIQKVYQKLFPQGLKFQIITIAGTNGKGSTCAFIDSIYQQSDFKSGKFTSPHIINYNERFTIDGIKASDGQICTAFEQIEQVRSGVSLTYFEFSTLTALLIFTQQNVDVAILEVGLGGRLDSVNVVDNNLSIITNIAIEHTQYLGATRAQIAAEKARVMRANKPCICADNNPPAAIADYAKQIGASLEFITKPYLGVIGLLGEYQQQNAQSAVRAVEILNDKFPISRAQITKGIQNTKLEGRFQIKTFANKTFILDVAHNPAAVQVLADELAKQTQPTLAIFSALKDKNITKMIEFIRPQIGRWILPPLNNQRAIEIQNLSNLFALGDNIQACDNMQKALKMALNDAAYLRIVIFGSFDIITDAIKAFNEFN